MGFVDKQRQMPDKRTAKERRKDFNEIYEEFDPVQAAEQANRCAQCGVPFCQVYCPLHNNIPDWLRLTSEGRLEEAYQMASMTNSFPEICGRICPQDKLCEGNCVVEQSGHGTVTIGAIEKYITEKAFDEGWVTPRMPPKELEQSVGIIGAGPAGMAAAEMLRSYGYQVTIYDRYDRVGGLMIYGIPSFKLEKYVMARRTEQLEEQGVKFKLDVDIGKDFSFDDLKAKHDALLIATGVYKARELMVPGAGLDGVVQALDYLTTSNKVSLGDKIDDFDSGKMNAQGKHVVVIGGGDTAMDCVRTAIRQKAKSVKCLYRRDKENMPGSMREVQNAEDEGVEFVWLSAPQALNGNAPKPVTSVRAQKMYLGEADASGRRSPMPLDGETENFKADMVISALGFEPEDLPAMFEKPDLTVTKYGTLQINEASKMTGIDGVFAAGDIVRGASLVVWAIKDGREAGEAIAEYISQKTEQQTIAAE